jgi:uncharacterized protein YcbK (DUF882 family)
MKAFAFAILLAGLLAGGYYWISYSKLSPDVQRKEKALNKALRKQGYKPHYFLLSGYRPHWLNQLMPLAAKNSDHQGGKAIDLFVIDIDGNGQFNDRDLTILSETVNTMDKNNPGQRGGVGLYQKSFSRMFHFDVSGHHRQWNY